MITKLANPLRQQRRKNPRTGAVVALAILLSAVGVAAYVALKPDAPKSPTGGGPEWLYWAQVGADGYWEAWVQRPDGTAMKATETTFGDRDFAEQTAVAVIEDYGGTPVRSLGPP